MKQQRRSGPARPLGGRVMSDFSSPVLVHSADPRDTFALGHELGVLARGGEVLGLVGDLGTGKTHLAQGIARGLGVPEEAYVCSPTFAFIHEHEGRLTFFHVDLYRLAESDEVVSIGYEDLFRPDTLVAVEWLDRFPELWPVECLRVVLADVGPTARRIALSGRGPVHLELLERWRASTRLVGQGGA
jgi:tRNA threonylcarbamoyladenosine biosynthesis protein TsaE